MMKRTESMRKTAIQFTEGKRMSLAQIIASGGPMKPRRAMEIARALCERLREETDKTDAGLPVLHPQAVLLSPQGTIAFSKTPVPDSAKEIYLPPEYIRGVTSRESVSIYGLGILLLFLVTGKTRKTQTDVGIRNRALKTVIDRCTSIDSRRRFQSLPEVYAHLNRELRFPRKRMLGILLALVLCIAAAVSAHLFIRGRTQGEAEGNETGYRNGYGNGYVSGLSDAPGIGIEDTKMPEMYGNFPGNLNAENGAFAVSGGEYLYYGNQGRICRMDPYSGEVSVLCEHETVSGLNYWDGSLFYLTENALVRMDPESGEEETVTENIGGRFCIYNGTLFLEDEKSTGYLYSIDAQTLEIRQLNGGTVHDALNVAETSLYYADPEKNGYLFRSDYDGGNAVRLLSKPCTDLDLCGGSVYCLTSDGEENGSIDILTHMNQEGGDAEAVTGRPVKRFVATESGIFYLDAVSGQLEWMTPDGDTKYTICAERIEEFNVAGRWIFFRKTGENALYRMRLDGSDIARLSSVE